MTRSAIVQRLSAAALATLLAAASLTIVAAPAAAKSKVLLTPWLAYGVPPEQVAEQEQRLLDAIRARGVWEPLRVTDLAAVAVPLAGCRDFHCQAHLAGVGAIDTIVGGTIAGTPPLRVLSLHRIEVPSGRILQRAIEILGHAPEAERTALNRVIDAVLAPPVTLSEDAARILIRDVEVEGAEEGTGRAVTEVALAEATAYGLYEIKSQRDTEQIVRLAECTSGCDDLRREAALDCVLIMRLASLGSTWVLTAKLIQLHGSHVLGRESTTLKRSEDVFVGVAEQLRRLLALAPRRQPGDPSYITRDPKDAERLIRAIGGAASPSEAPPRNP